MTLVAPRGRHSSALDLPDVAILATDGAMTKAQIEVGGRPVLWHAMKQLAEYGMRRFALGLDADPGLVSGVAIDRFACTERVRYGERLLALRARLGSGAVLVSSGEQLTDIDFGDLLAFHRSHQRLATVIAVRPPARFGKLEIKDNQVIEFCEKPEYEQGWIAADLTIIEPEAFDYVSEDADWPAILDRLAADDQLVAFKHASFWGGVTTLRDRQELEELWQSGKAPWKNWK